MLDGWSLDFGPWMCCLPAVVKCSLVPLVHGELIRNDVIYYEEYVIIEFNKGRSLVLHPDWVKRTRELGTCTPINEGKSGAILSAPVVTSLDRKSTRLNSSHAR